MSDSLPIPTNALFTFQARCVYVVDGDTFDAELDQGLHNRRTERLRLLGVNCPEMKGASRDAGREARVWVAHVLTGETGDDRWPLILRTEKLDAFGRYLAHTWRRPCMLYPSGLYLNAAIIEAGHGVPYTK